LDVKTEEMVKIALITLRKIQEVPVEIAVASLSLCNKAHRIIRYNLLKKSLLN